MGKGGVANPLNLNPTLSSLTLHLTTEISKWAGAAQMCVNKWAGAAQMCVVTAGFELMFSESLRWHLHSVFFKRRENQPIYLSVCSCAHPRVLVRRYQKCIKSETHSVLCFYISNRVVR